MKNFFAYYSQTEADRDWVVCPLHRLENDEVVRATYVSDCHNDPIERLRQIREEHPDYEFLGRVFASVKPGILKEDV